MGKTPALAARKVFKPFDDQSPPLLQLGDATDSGVGLWIFSEAGYIARARRSRVQTPESFQEILINLYLSKKTQREAVKKRVLFVIIANKKR